MTRLLAIDPGPRESGYCLIDQDTRRPVTYGKAPNATLLNIVWRHALTAGSLMIEMVDSYGMPVGREVFETCVWVGRFYERGWLASGAPDPALVYRLPVRLHHCHSSKAKDSNVIQALVDRFASGVPNRGKGTKANPGWFHGFAGDVWQAYALAVYAADKLEAGEPL